MVKGRRPSGYAHLASKWQKRHRTLSENLWKKHGKALTAIAAGSLSGLLLLAPPKDALPPSPSRLLVANSTFVTDVPSSLFVIADLTKVLPHDIRPLTTGEEDAVLQILSRAFGFRVTGELEGKRLGRSYGIIGQEQHLARYPGDTLATHFDTAEDAQQFSEDGMAPGLSAWGYSAPSKVEMTDQDTLREKYYIAVQTFLAQDFYQRFVEYNEFFKYRKMLVVNPQNGKAVIVVVGDVGPATWTGKHLGGSPEVIQHLERVDGPRKGPVLFFFIDDPEDRIPLGPIEAYNTVG